MVRHKNRYLLIQVQYKTPFIEAVSDNDSEIDDSGMDEPVRKKSKGVLKRYPDSSKVLYDAIVGAIDEGFGVFGRGAVKRSLSMKYWNSETGCGVVRCARQWHEMVITAVNSVNTFTFVNEERKSDTCDASLRILHVSGTISLCSKAALSLGKAFIASVDIPEDDEDRDDDDDEY